MSDYELSTDEEEDFGRKIYIDDDEDDEDGVDEESSDEEINVMDERKFDKNKKSLGKSTSTFSKRIPSTEEPVAKKPRFDSAPSTNEVKEMMVEDNNVAYKIPMIQQTLYQRQNQQQNSFTCPLCYKHCVTKQSFDRHLLVHDDILTTLQLYYWEDNPGENLEEATEEWEEIIRTSKKPKPISVNHTGGNDGRQYMYIEGEYYGKDGQKLVVQNAMEKAMINKTKEPLKEEALKKLIHSEFFY